MGPSTYVVARLLSAGGLSTSQTARQCRAVKELSTPFNTYAPKAEVEFIHLDLSSLRCPEVAGWSVLPAVRSNNAQCISVQVGEQICRDFQEQAAAPGHPCLQCCCLDAP